MNYPDVSGAELRARREVLGLSRQALATRAGISIASIEKYEGGWRPRWASVVLGLILAALTAAEAEAQDERAAA